MRVADYHICRQLTNMMNDAASWCGASGELREMPAEYFVGPSEREKGESVEYDHTLQRSTLQRLLNPQ